MVQHLKYPRTSHLPFSLGIASEDRVIEALDSLTNAQEIIITEKLDGECTTLYCDGLHARSTNATDHPSRTWVKALQGRIAHDIPPTLCICGENLYAKHSIYYEGLPSYFLVFGMFERDICLSWDATVEWCGLLGLHPVAMLYRGKWDEKAVRACYTGISVYGGRQEGYVVRDAAAFPTAEFSVRVGKWVRANHVQTDAHWVHQAMIPNGLKA